MIADLKKGGKFEELAQQALAWTRARGRKGGDLDWNVPGDFDKAFADAMVKLDKGKMTETPVRTRFGFHVIQLDDVRRSASELDAGKAAAVQQRLRQASIES